MGWMWYFVVAIMLQWAYYCCNYGWDSGKRLLVLPKEIIEQISSIPVGFYALDDKCT